MERIIENIESVRAKILDDAKKCVCGQRTQDYGSPEDNFGKIAKYWSVYLDKEISAQDVCNLMALMKMGRITSGTATRDSYVDLAGYAACGGEIATKNKTDEE